MGAIIAPFLVMASASSGAGSSAMVPFLVFGVASVLASLLIFTLPETLGVPLPDTMEVGGAGHVRSYVNYRLAHTVCVSRPAAPLGTVDSQTHRRCAAAAVVLQDMENIASVFTHKTWQTGGLSAATKSMFKARVKFTKTKRPAKTPQLLVPVPESPLDGAQGGSTPGASGVPSPAPVSSSKSLLGGTGQLSSAL